MSGFDPRPDPHADHQAIRALLLADAPCTHAPFFTRVSEADLALLFAAYDARVFEGALSKALTNIPLEFRVSTRLVRSLGVTRRWEAPRRRYEIAVSGLLLFDNFRPEDPPVMACGLPCPDRLTALQRVFEHELVHLAEWLAFDTSSCAGDRFAAIAEGLFGHRARFHGLVTRRERARAEGIGPGSWVRFEHEGRPVVGRVNRITRRATVLVPDPQGRRFTDGHRYLTVYVPLADLSPAPTPPSHRPR